MEKSTQKSTRRTKLATLAMTLVPVGVMISTIGFMNFDDNFALKITLQSLGALTCLTAAILLIREAGLRKKEESASS